MLERDIETIRRLFDLWPRRDWVALEALHHPDVVVVAPEGWPEAGTFEGWQAWLRQAMRITDSWESDSVAVEQIEPAGDRVAARYVWSTKGRDSQIDFETRMRTVFTMREGRIARIEFFLEPGSAPPGPSYTRSP